MKKKLALYVLALYLVSAGFFILRGLEELNSRVEKMVSELRRVLNQRRIAYSRMETIEKLVEKEGIRVYTRKEALEMLLNELRSLQREFEVSVKGDIEEGNHFWKVNVSFKIKPSSPEELREFFEKISSKKAPIASSTFL
jgi:hypothetical protein